MTTATGGRLRDVMERICAKAVVAFSGTVLAGGTEQHNLSLAQDIYIYMRKISNIHSAITVGELLLRTAGSHRPFTRTYIHIR